MTTLEVLKTIGKMYGLIIGDISILLTNFLLFTTPVLWSEMRMKEFKVRELALFFGSDTNWLIPSILWLYLIMEYLKPKEP